VPHMLQEQADHVAHLVHRCLAEGIRSFEATPEAVEEWQQVMDAYNEVRRPFQEACTPGYFNAEGKPRDRRSNITTGIYQPSTQFFQWLEEWREAGDAKGLVLTK